MNTLNQAGKSVYPSNTQANSDKILTPNQAEIPQLIRNLETISENVHKSLAELEGKLSSILRSQNPTTEDSVKEPSRSTELGEQLFNLCRVFNQLDKRVCDIKARVEL